MSSATGLLPRPPPYVDYHALDRYDQRVDPGRTRWSFARATVCGVVTDGPELTEKSQAPWISDQRVEITEQPLSRELSLRVRPN